MSTEARHGTPRHREIAADNTILRGQVGSGLHGVTTGADDRDEMGICMEPPEAVIGLEKFEQYIFRTQPDGVRSGAGDLDLIVYSLRKWTKLAAEGNPSVLLMLWIPDVELVTNTEMGAELQASADLFVTKQAGRKFLGYLNSQREGVEGTHHRHTNRPELIAEYGFDTKYAYHALRLGIQGIELMTQGSIPLPMTDGNRRELLKVRKGEVPLEVVKDQLNDITANLESAIAQSSWRDTPDWGRINRWLVDMYARHWGLRGT
ncbi:Predicted nucleotidyltransferase [Mycobacteroides abscessus subsp. bolletii]|uniref:nucleotidyltransferase domain-containing protein n=1 Tax=Mycobacteroides abscessus TaxID=36809 RepID=UPI000927E23C|nr:nucleotidyltransferase domain-containing protein [Mycobacteroides abscessus]SHQ62649.1 Predicted nucleotidyltransferase [Mycobacteroides abscessus subsp. bolletii]SHS46342.1 Predicted nucleotidyltransferase [Mycobacteroides abscessus subsp. bolletii]SHT08508.1 Predicted nucleotidyltransferase [Mycobacteroides abscessus subsp. bolletii]SHT13243.1 Predicted nucleotidyltransferase [Mycobacteroides abscessus subsp. bolletii]SHY51450.1 Predicted nucleotidyltransferase [Mycobacteroides abscessus 